MKVDSVSWLKITIDGKDFKEVLLIGEQVFPRDYQRLQKLFGTSHQLGNWEKEILLKGSPEVIIIGNGYDGCLEVDEAFEKRIKEKNIELKILHTPLAVREYNVLTAAGKKVNALIHTTC